MARSQNNTAEQILKSLLNATAADLGESFFCSLVKNLSVVLKTSGAWVTEFNPETRKLQAAGVLDG